MDPKLPPDPAGRFEFEGDIYLGPRGGYYVDFPFDAEKVFGTKKSIKVKAWINGYFLRKSLLPKGDGSHWLSVSTDIRAAIGKGDGDRVSVVVEQDTEPRTVDLPEDLKWLLDNEPDLMTLFLAQGYYTQKFFSDWICQSKDPDTRVNRINHLFYRLRQQKAGKRGNILSDPL